MTARHDATIGRTVALVVWAGVVTALVLWRGVPLDRAQVLAVCLTGLLAASIGARGRAWSAVRDWVPIALALALYDLLRGLADELGRAVQVRAPARLDEFFFGAVPSVWLQDHIPADATWWFVAASLLYASHFVVPFAVAAMVWWRSPEQWVRWRRRFLGVTAVALASFLIVPVAPPWVAARVGEIGPVTRNASSGWSSLGLDVAADAISFGQATTNLYAAMPSLHTAFAVVTAITVWPLLSRPAALVVLLYPAALGFALVSSGEHYVVDVVAGVTLAATVHLGWRRWERGRAFGRDRDDRIEGELVPSRRTWVGPIVGATVLAVVLRAIRLDRPRVLVYDEVFYVNDALDLALLGRQPAAFHPPFAKLLIAPFVGLGGVDPFTWRLPMMLCGVAVVAGVGATAWLATGDRRLCALAGVLAATDGLLIVTSRVALLDGAVALCVAAMLVGLVGVVRPGGWAETGRGSWAPLVALGGAAVGVATKWALVPAAAVTLVALTRPVQRRYGGRLSVAGAALCGAFGAVTIAAWGPVVLRPPAAVSPTSAAIALVADSIDMADHHLNLERSGSGHASAFTWIAQTEPTTLYERRCGLQPDVVDHVCRPGSFASARIVAVGNTVLWVIGTAALVLLAFRVRRSPPAAVTFTLGASLWLPWVLPGTAPYSFYGAAVAPVLAVAVAVALHDRRQRVWSAVVIGALAAGWLVLHYPELTAIT